MTEATSGYKHVYIFDAQKLPVILVTSEGSLP